MGYFARLRRAREQRKVNRLRQALEQHEIRGWYQPLICGEAGNVAGCEILARWHHPLTGILGADAFIPVAERSGLIVPLTHSLICQAVQDLSGLPLPDGFRVSVNLSAAHASSEVFFRDCLALKQALAFCRGTVCAEVTERDDFTRVEGGLALVDALQDAGVSVFLDDFGTGCTGLSALELLPVDGIKLDRCHVKAIPRTGEVSMAEMILMMARQYSLSVVAEGVETAEQHAWLLAQGQERHKHVDHGRQ